jgi:hypothetical protein
MSLKLVKNTVRMLFVSFQKKYLGLDQNLQIKLTFEDHRRWGAYIDDEGHLEIHTNDQWNFNFFCENHEK